MASSLFLNKNKTNNYLIFKYLQLVEMQTGKRVDFRLNTITYYIISALMRMLKFSITQNGVEQMTIQQLLLSGEIALV